MFVVYNFIDTFPDLLGIINVSLKIPGKITFLGLRYVLLDDVRYCSIAIIPEVRLFL